MRKGWKQKVLEALCASVCVSGGDGGGLEVQSVGQPMRARSHNQEGTAEEFGLNAIDIMKLQKFQRIMWQATL